MDDAEQLLPVYLRFVRGVIDSADLPLNVSREILQESKDIEAIRTGNVKRVLSMIEDLAANDEPGTDPYSPVNESKRVDTPAGSKESLGKRHCPHVVAAPAHRYRR